ncbi:MAG: hypothetical protein JWM90_1471 [Thermoleophilia bacterium]|nr:hypothetical protein [Thermoleophilia bacterium]
MRVRSTTPHRRLRLFGTVLLGCGVTTVAIALVPGVIDSSTVAVRAIDVAGIVALSGMLIAIVAHWWRADPRRAMLAAMAALILTLTLAPMDASVGTWRPTVTSTGKPAVIHVSSLDEESSFHVTGSADDAVVRAVVLNPWVDLASRNVGVGHCIRLDDELAGRTPTGDGRETARDYSECR